jgi:hypothetical protein
LYGIVESVVAYLGQAQDYKGQQVFKLQESVLDLNLLLRALHSTF